MKWNGLPLIVALMAASCCSEKVGQAISEYGTAPRAGTVVNPITLPACGQTDFFATFLYGPGTGKGSGVSLHADASCQHGNIARTVLDATTTTCAGDSDCSTGEHCCVALGLCGDCARGSVVTAPVVSPCRDDGDSIDWIVTLTNNTPAALSEITIGWDRVQ
jgi:hypothetical protein